MLKRVPHHGLLVFLALFWLWAGCATLQTPKSSDGLPGFRQVDQGFYRGAQPSPEGLERLAKRGIKTVISLRQRGPAMKRERRQVEALGMRWVQIPMWFWWRPSDRQVEQFLRLVTDPANRPVFVHCRQGWNRVGIMTAIYRIAHQGWSPQQAYAEGRQFGLVGWNPFTQWLLFHKIPRAFAAAR